jgi:hypothetical protein
VGRPSRALARRRARAERLLDDHGRALDEPALGRAEAQVDRHGGRAQQEAGVQGLRELEARG